MAENMCTRGGIVFQAHRLCVSLNSRLESNEEEQEVTWIEWLPSDRGLAIQHFWKGTQKSFLVTRFRRYGSGFGWGIYPGSDRTPPHATAYFSPGDVPSAPERAGPANTRIFQTTGVYFKPQEYIQTASVYAVCCSIRLRRSVHFNRGSRFEGPGFRACFRVEEYPRAALVGPVHLHVVQLMHQLRLLSR